MKEGFSMLAAIRRVISDSSDVGKANKKAKTMKSSEDSGDGRGGETGESVLRLTLCQIYNVYEFLHALVDTGNLCPSSSRGKISCDVLFFLVYPCCRHDFIRNANVMPKRPRLCVVSTIERIFDEETISWDVKENFS